MIARPFRRPGPIPYASTVGMAALMPAPGPSPRLLPLACALEDRSGHAHNPLMSPSPPHSGRPRAPSGALPAPGPARPPAGHHAEPLEPSMRPPTQGPSAIYLGDGVLTVRSTHTGHTYRFEGHGCRLPIDPRDSLLLGRLPDVVVHAARRAGT